jgi:ADP-ribosyl-[dinitrogen reductase] hydrolase
MNIELKDRFLGCLVGLAVGDAYGTTYEFKRRSNMPKELPDDIVGGGPFDMNPGEWTDDTSMALCLAESLVEKGWDTDDQMRRYIKWWQDGYNSVKGECFDIGGATRQALSWYNMTNGEQFVQDTQAAGNGVLMRLAPIPMWLFDKEDCVFTLSHCAFQSVMTHPSSQSIQCSMLLGAIINKILSGEKDKEKILKFDLLDDNSKQMYKEVFEKYSCHTNGRIEGIKNMEYINYPLEQLSGDGYCVYTLEAALWAFATTDDFKDGLKKVVSLGDDTDTTGAVYGQIAGAYYGINNIPWVDKITWIDKIKKLASDLYEANQKED